MCYISAGKFIHNMMKKSIDDFLKVQLSTYSAAHLSFGQYPTTGIYTASEQVERKYRANQLRVTTLDSITSCLHLKYIVPQLKSNVN